ncbi:hypothetical protein CA13_00430 [Planctomycetes bacterium CA13]|uniref:Uncharacterized protein n=1 Tax=Novipirellula herctigrandis TaxID=2527986 RepID=A0A5C5YVV3_9BACT|nr:hypothetical protein CA13_00430 [Planctomycetes bacterium CA13]
MSRLLSTVTAFCLVTLYIATNAGADFALAYLLGFVVISTVWLNIFGVPRLKGWIGYATRSRLDAMKLTYSQESQTNG